jgi:hypothetical protein
VSTDTATSTTPCPACHGKGPHARRDGHRYDSAPGAACPDCGAVARAPEMPRDQRILARLAALFEVLRHLDDDELEGQLHQLELRAQRLDPRDRSVSVSVSESKACPLCGGASRGHRFARRLLVCTSCATLWSRTRQGQVVIEPAL